MLLVGSVTASSQCWNRVFGFELRVTGSTILAGSGRVTGQCDRPGFCSFVVKSHAMIEQGCMMTIMLEIFVICMFAA